MDTSNFGYNIPSSLHTRLPSFQTNLTTDHNKSKPTVGLPGKL